MRGTIPARASFRAGPKIRIFSEKRDPENDATGVTFPTGGSAAGRFLYARRTGREAGPLSPTREKPRERSQPAGAAMPNYA